MSTFLNTFSQGMDQDSSKNKYDNVHYFEAENIRMITQDGLSSGAIENVIGNLLRVQCTVSGNNYVIGHLVLRDHLILWTTTNTAAPNESSTDRVWKVPITSIESLTASNSLTLNITRFHLGGHLIYEGNLGFSTLNKIRGVGRYESTNIQKIYWIDGYNRLRHLNTVHNPDYNNLITLQKDKLEVISNFDINRPNITGFDSGNLFSGKVQYTYQLYTINGGETVFSPASDLMNISEYNETDSTSIYYKGSNIEVNTGKSIRGTINIISTGYNRIRIVAIHYTTLDGDPEIRVIDEKPISSLGETISFIDTGQRLFNYTLEEVRLLGTYLFIPKEIATKDNILFPANITEQAFDINFDARAYRFAGASSTSTAHNFQYTLALRRKSRIYDQDGNYYEGDGTNPTGTWLYYNSLGVAVPANNVTGWINIPSTFDAINKFNSISNDGNHDFRFIYQTDGFTVGGEGSNIKYRFKIKPIEIDDDSGISSIKTGLEGTVDNPSFKNYASPYQCAKYLGYARDEVYRFGIVFFDEKGRSSFVKWIGDIRTPSISTIGDHTYNPSGGTFVKHIIRLSFSDYYSGDCKYVIEFDNDPLLKGEYINYGESSIDEVLDAVVSAIQSIPGGIIVNTTVDYVNDRVDIEFWTSGTHTISRLERRTLIPDVQITFNYTNTILQAYAPPGGSISDFSPVYYDTSDNKIKANVLYPEFTVNLTGTEAAGLSYQIVRVRRSSNDRSIKAIGIVSGTFENGTVRNPYIHSINTSWSTNTVCFNSPEIAFNKNIQRQSGDILQVIGTYTQTQADLTSPKYLLKYRGILPLTHPQDRILPTPVVATVGDEFYSLNKTEVNAGTLVTMDDTEAIIGEFTYNNELRTTGGTPVLSNKGTNFLCRIATPTWVGLNTLYTARHVVAYKRDVFLYQYDGPTYSARSRSIYIATGRVQKSDNAIIPVFDGDTYITMFDYLHGGWKIDETTSGRMEVNIFPVETSINLDLRMDACYHDRAATTNVHLMRERAGIYTAGVNEYTQPTDLYIYNTVYSRENVAKLFISKPFDWVQQTSFDNRILASTVKTNNELADSWLKYGANSYLDIDPQYGELVALVNNNNQLLFFQPKAFGTLSINERALLQTQNISQLSLGSSGILSRFDYAKTEIGTSHKDHILLTPNALYWIDIINKAMYKFTGGPEELSLMKGMGTWFRSKLSLGIPLSSMLLYYDPVYKELNFVSNESGKTFNLTYNELTDSFVSLYTFYPKYVISYNDKVISSNDQLNFYKHNDAVANRCQFYNNPTRSESSITLIVNPSETNVCIFSNLEWLTEVYNGLDNLPAETFTGLRISNDYQDTGVISLVSGQNVKRRIRRWRYTIGRALYDELGNTMSRADARLRDSYAKIKFIFNNTNARKFVAHDIITSFMISNK